MFSPESGSPKEKAIATNGISQDLRLTFRDEYLAYANNYPSLVAITRGVMTVLAENPDLELDELNRIIESADITLTDVDNPEFPLKEYISRIYRSQQRPSHKLR